MTSIRDRLNKLPPYEDDIKIIQDIKKNMPPQLEEKEHAEEEVASEETAEETTEELAEESTEGSTEESGEDEKPKTEVSKRTAEQINKLTRHNKQLKEENTKLYKNVLESLKPQEPTPEVPLIPPMQEFAPQVTQQIDKNSSELKPDQVDDIYADLIDKDGYIDPHLLIQTLRQANEEARKARQEAEEANKRAILSDLSTKKSIRDFEEDREVRRVHRKYPQIDPKNKEFNEMFWDDVRKELATAPYLKGKTISFMEASNTIWNQRYANQKEEVEMKKKEKEVIEEAENAKRNINASVPSGHFSGYYSQTDQEALRQATIVGKRGALAERLRRAGQ